MFCSSHRPSLQFFGAGESISGELCWFVSLLIHMTLSSHATLANLQVHIPVMPHPMRKIAQSDDVIVVFLPLWVDDVSEIAANNTTSTSIYMHATRTCLESYFSRSFLFDLFPLHSTLHHQSSWLPF
jgi:hypothetical protein